MMAEAVSYVHSKNVVHRDIKLDNFLVDVDCETNVITVKLCDFGFAKVLPKGAAIKGRAGTLIAMAPEIISGQVYDYKVDCWALGVCLFELLLDRFPFYHEDREVLEQQILRGKIDFKQLQKNFGLSYGAVDLMSLLLEKNPTKRISAQQILEHWWLSDLIQL